MTIHFALSGIVHAGFVAVTLAFMSLLAWYELSPLRRRRRYRRQILAACIVLTALTVLGAKFSS